MNWYDGIIWPNGNEPYSVHHIPERNRWMADASDIVLCYVYREGGTRQTVEYARKKGKQIICL